MSRLNSATPLAEIDSDAVDPLDGHGVQEFDWSTVYKHLDREKISKEDRDKLIECLRIILQWIIGPTSASRVNMKSAGRRIFALAWVISPGYYSTSPSMRWLAKKCGMSRSAFAKFTVSASRFFRIRNRASIAHAHNMRPVVIDSSLSQHDRDVIRAWCAVVDIRAESNMLKTHRVEGAHFNAAKQLREEIGI